MSTPGASCAQFLMVLAEVATLYIPLALAKCYDIVVDAEATKQARVARPFGVGADTRTVRTLSRTFAVQTWRCRHAHAHAHGQHIFLTFAVQTVCAHAPSTCNHWRRANQDMLDEITQQMTLVVVLHCASMVVGAGRPIIGVAGERVVVSAQSDFPLVLRRSVALSLFRSVALSFFRSFALSLFRSKRKRHHQGNKEQVLLRRRLHTIVFFFVLPLSEQRGTSRKSLFCQL